MTQPIPAQWIMLAQQVDEGTQDQAQISILCENDPEFLLYLITRKKCQLQGER